MNSSCGMKEIEFFMIEIVNTVAQSTVDTTEKAFQVIDFLFQPPGRQQIVTQNGNSMSDIILLLVDALIFSL